MLKTIKNYLSIILIIILFLNLIYYLDIYDYLFPFPNYERIKSLSLVDLDSKLNKEIDKQLEFLENEKKERNLFYLKLTGLVLGVSLSIILYSKFK
jgi:hypothetical protein